MLAFAVVVSFALLTAGIVFNSSLGGTTAPDPTSSPTERATPTRSTEPAGAPTTAPPSGQRASYCKVADQLTPYRSFDDYGRTYLDWTYTLPSTYAPPDLVPVSMAGFTGEGRANVVRAIVIDDLTALRAAAGAAGHQLAVLSAYRSYGTQQATFAYWVNVGGYDQALRSSARAGHSEHQLGTAIDFSSGGTSKPWENDDWATTPPGKWLAQNAWRYGFVLSYPAGTENVTCYEYEPWHYRWVGRDEALAVLQSGLTLRAFLAR